MSEQFGLVNSFDSQLQTPGFNALIIDEAAGVLDNNISFTPNPHYERYLRMHKLFVGMATSHELITIGRSLEDEVLPRYTSAAAWAYTEAALVNASLPSSRRLELLDKAENNLLRSLRLYQELNNSKKDYLVEPAAPYRTALDIAVLPLLRGVVEGDVAKQTSEAVFRDCLNIAQANAVQLQLAVRAGDIEAVGDHVGFGYECNALLSLNRMKSNTWFAIPALARADSGHHHREQTHDLLVIRQKWGNIRSIIPVEIKSTASLRDRNRYKALLVRGKMHLSYAAQHHPSQTLESISAVEEGRATKRQQYATEAVSDSFMRMLKDYYFGKELGIASCRRALPCFRDNQYVIENHPGLSKISLVA